MGNLCRQGGAMLMNEEEYGWYIPDWLQKKIIEECLNNLEVSIEIINSIEARKWAKEIQGLWLI